MSTPTQQQGSDHYARQAAISLAAGQRVADMVSERSPWSQVLAALAGFQLKAAAEAIDQMVDWSANGRRLADPRAFVGVSSYGFPIAEPLIATIDYREPAPAQPIPAPWWDDEESFLEAVENLVHSEIADTGRSASQVEFVAHEDWTNYVRMLTPPSCKRCAILAGRIYRDLDAFARHPGCDCVMVPVDSWEEAHDAGLASSFTEEFENGNVRDLSEADEQAIRDGADPNVVVNATRGTSAPGITNALDTKVFGRDVKATTYGTTKRARWRRQNPTRLVRLRPESIYEIAGEDRSEALRLLTLYGYINQ